MMQHASLPILDSCLICARSYDCATVQLQHKLTWVWGCDQLYLVAIAIICAAGDREIVGKVQVHNAILY
jgi:hypothetical protein